MVGIGVPVFVNKSAVALPKRLPLQRQFRLTRQSQLRDGSSLFAQLNVNSAGFDDRITREGRYLDKLVDELAKGNSMDKILSKP